MVSDLEIRCATLLLQYLIRVDVRPDASLVDAIPRLLWDEAVVLTTHAIEDAYNFDGSMDGPALGVVDRL